MLEQMLEEFEKSDGYIFLEEGNDDPKFKEKEGILTKIGTAVVNIFESFYKYISRIVEAVIGKKKSKEEKDLRSNVQIVNDMCSRNPEYRDEIAKSINKEWLTYKDVASYENDIVGLINALQQARIDKETFLEKLKRKKDEFVKDGGLTRFAVTASTVTTAVVSVFKLKHWIQNTKNSTPTPENESVMYESETIKADKEVLKAIREALKESGKERVRVYKNYDSFRSFINSKGEAIKNKQKND